MSEVPDLLTVEEAARYLRIGRTKAYAMTRQWRSSGGRAGLPVVDLDHVLRVPRSELEQVIGTKLTTPVFEIVSQAPPPVLTAASTIPADEDSSGPPVIQEPARRARRTRRPDPRTSQPGLFDTPDPAA
jgi:hypothetical protein